MRAAILLNRRMPLGVLPRRHPRRWPLSIVAALVGAALLALVARALNAARGVVPPSTTNALFQLADRPVPEDPVLLEELRKAIDLRTREHFDRVLDAREPGELVEHATLTEQALDRRVVGI